ncbi:hypothetical protein EC973_000890 [Apophysomyces ossiformis]|uniref:Uncharacterized protein n=1 Tax=Apophysomyces ossiformis TaxID=679940 RepID=A0A8H7ESB0_9FUNG|nr:hypothetical protein EC973_000890 [Apophysomyces ossiformis]
MTSPSHPGDPKWKSRAEWTKISECKAIEMKKTEEETRTALLERFGLTDDSQGDGWGPVEDDSSDTGFDNGTFISKEDTDATDDDDVVSNDDEEEDADKARVIGKPMAEEE